MEHTFILMMAGLTSLVTYILGVKGLRLSSSDLRAGFGKTCEGLGLTLVFFVLNLMAGLILVYAARWIMGRFVSLYHLSDTTLLVLSLLQALTFQAWQASSACRTDANGRRGDRLGHDR